MMQTDAQTQQDNFGTDEQYEQLEKYLLSLNGVISECLEVARQEHGEAKISIHKSVTPVILAAGLRLYVVLPWPTIESTHLANLSSFLKHACNLWAKPRGLEVFGSGPDLVAGGAYVIWIGAKKLTEKEFTTSG